jgi:hypothetical protein
MSPHTPRKPPQPPQPVPRADDEDDGDREAAGGDDRATILEETSHLPDRDQLFDPGQKVLPGSGTPPTGDQWVDEDADWAEDLEERVVGDHTTAIDAVDELENAHESTRGFVPKSEAESDPTPVPSAEDEELAQLSLGELTRRGAALGVAGRADMGRRQLIDAIRAAMTRGQ